jgi:hypothetical protein
MQRRILERTIRNEKEIRWKLKNIKSAIRKK